MDYVFFHIFPNIGNMIINLCEDILRLFRNKLIYKEHLVKEVTHFRDLFMISRNYQKQNSLNYFSAYRSFSINLINPLLPRSTFKIRIHIILVLAFNYPSKD